MSDEDIKRLAAVLADNLIGVHQQHLPLKVASACLDCSEKYLRKHKREFGAWRMPGGHLRFPASIIERMAKKRALK